ncbi:MAG: class I SAM-dependent methyltransferase [Pseudomonadota bacterium]
MIPSDTPVSTVLGVFAYDPSPPIVQQLTQQLSQHLCLPLLSKAPESLPSGQFVLAYDLDGKLQLHFTGLSVPNPIVVDFIAGANNHRRRYGGGKGQLLAKAVGIKGAFRPTILDLTAGLGADAFVLATLGCAVELLERVALVAALLRDGIERARLASDPDIRDIADRLSLIPTSAFKHLPARAQPVDVIYLDPMFPERGKSAQVKKTMAAFHALVGSDGDAGHLLPMALKKARYRVVVKRPRKAPSMDQQWPELELPKPNLVLPAKSTRFDIYTQAKMP